ncbi:MAG: polysaccharide deacetylase family protein [Chloroflexaceae bacterium]|nr:polysaccharide deacetylase family protein [Chloroflexaceae bacterium]
MRMREGVTTTLRIFAPYGVRATYFATGYNFLAGNTERRQFIGNPTYAWANTENRWTSNRWTETPWFAPDPYGTNATHPEWYFADLVPLLKAADQDIQSHTFSHFYGGFVTAADWRSDLATWAEVAAPHDVPPATVLAFPWSSSGGMSDASWQALADAGIATVTRTSKQSQFNLFPRGTHERVLEPHCRPLPGHAAILACPDFYLTPTSLDWAIEQIDYTIEQGGLIDIWAHTEEVITPQQQAAWQRVVHYAATNPAVWVAPLHEQTTWQRAVAEVQVLHVQGAQGSEPLIVALPNGACLAGVALRLPFAPQQVAFWSDGGLPTQQVLTVDYRLEDNVLIFEHPICEPLEVHAWLRT